jgi:hypothetical protein
MNKKLLITFSSLLVLVIGAGLAGRAWLLGRFEKDAVIQQMESAWNCRAYLDHTSASLLSSPARVEFHGLKLALRDSEVAKPLNQRAPFVPESALLSVDKVSLAVSLQDLINGSLNVKELHLAGVNLRTVVDEEGESTLDVLFDSPQELAAAAQVPPSPATPIPVSASLASAPASEAPVVTPSITSEAGKGKGGSLPKKRKVKEEKKPFMASDLGLALQVQVASVEQGRMEIVDRQSGTRTLLENVSLALKNIDVDPGNLAQHNHSDFDFAGKIGVDKPADKLQVASFEVSGNGSLEPFEAKTGLWSPDLDLAVLIKKGGLLSGAPLSSQMRPKDLEKLKDSGLDLSGLAIGGVLLEDASTEIHAVRGSKLIVKKDTILAFPQYEIAMLESSWINAPEDQHITRGRLVASPELTASMLEGARKTLVDKVGESLADLALTAISATLLDEQKRLVIPFKSRGSLAKPEVSLDTAFAGATDALKDAGKSLLEGLLGK